MMTAMRAGVIALAGSLLMNATGAYAETITATCYEPSGNRIDFVNGTKEESKDGFSNSNPTFFFTSAEPDVLIESWQAALPFPELIDRERVDDIAPPSVTKSIIISRSEFVIHAISTLGRDVYSTTLYLADGFGIFTRVRINEGELAPTPMGAIYAAKCNFSVIE